MYLLAFKNNEEREELYNGAMAGNFCSKFLVDEGLGGKKKGEEKKCQKQKNEKKKCVLHACFRCILQNTHTSSIKLQPLFLRASHERSQRPFDVGVVLIDRP